MHNLSLIETYFKRFTSNLSNHLLEDIIEIDLNMLHQLDLLKYYDPACNDPSLARYFHVIESEEKITLINSDFIVWIVPETVEEIPLTCTLIALNNENEPQLEMCFVTSGVYNNSRLVLRVLEKFLQEIQENEALMEQIEKDVG